MKLTTAVALFSVVLLSGLGEHETKFTALGKRPSRPSSGGSRGSRGPSKISSSKNRRGNAPVSRRRMELDENEYDDEDDMFEDPDFLGGLDDEEDYDEYADEDPLEPVRPKRNNSPTKRKAGSSKSKRQPPPSRYQDEYDDYDYEEEYNTPRHSRDKGPSPSSRRPNSKRGSARSRGGRPNSGRSGSSRGGRGGRGRVVPYTRQQESTFTRGLTALRQTLPDPNMVKDKTLGAMAAAKERTSKLSKGIYREVKGLTSSELEQVMLKATRPDDTPVKGKHVERLVGVTYQISGRYDIYDAVLRKLWNKMTESDWRTKIKSLYILHRFSSDGAPDHQASLKARLRELRRTKDPKRKDKYFNSKQLLACDATPDNASYRAFLARYAHYVLLRVQCFGGIFSEISMANESRTSKSGKSSSQQNKPITSTAFRTEHLEGATLLLKAGCAASFKEGEDCEHTAVAMERVAADMIGLTSAVATTLNRVLKSEDLESDKSIDKALVKRWCEFYAEELLPKTKILVKRTSRKLDRYGLFLPSRMSATVRPEVLERGLTLGNEEVETTQDGSKEDNDAEVISSASNASEEKAEEESTGKVEEPTDEDDEEEHVSQGDEEDVDEEVADKPTTNTVDEFDEEYEYDEEEYYDEE